MLPAPPPPPHSPSPPPGEMSEPVAVNILLTPSLGRQDVEGGVEWKAEDEGWKLPECAGCQYMTRLKLLET